MKAKKIVALLLTCGMVVSGLAGCGETGSESSRESSQESRQEESGQDSEQETGQESTGQTEEEAGGETGKITFPLEEPVTMTMFSVTGSEFNLEDSATMKKMEELTNVHWEIQNVPSTEAQEKRGLALNSGEYPDIFMKGGLTTGELAEHGKEGTFIPLEDLMREYAPNFCQAMDARDQWDSIVSPDGHIYGFPELEEKSYLNVLLWINKSWLDNLGLEKPTTKDEFYEVLKAFKEQDANGDGDPNNEIPFIASSDLATIEDMAPFFGLYYGGFWDDYAIMDDKMVFWPGTENWKECLAYLHKLYDEELLYNQLFTTTIEQARAMGLSGTPIGCMFEWNPCLTVGTYADGGKEMEYEALELFDGYKFTAGAGLQYGTFAITDKCQYPEIAVAWVDYFYSEEGGRLAGLGVEGVSYEVNDEGLWSYIMDGEYGDRVEFAATMWQGGGVGLPMRHTDFEYYSKYVDKDVNPGATIVVDTLKRLRDNDKLGTPWPSLSYTEEESERMGALRADIDAYWKQYRAGVITGKEDLDATWDNYLSTLEQMKVSELTEIYQAAYERSKTGN